MNKFKLAILDLYEGAPNQGMRCINEIVSRYDSDVEHQVFDVRSKNEVPDTSFDIYISSGGPGSPLDGNGVWDTKWYELMDQLWAYNLNPENERKKYVFFICHSFQMICHHFEIGSLSLRNSPSFGTFPIPKTRSGARDPLFKGLNNPLYGADFRSWQVTQANWEVIEAIGAKILAREKIRPHVQFERAIMAIRFSPEFVGTQFHPEADPEGMREHFMDPARQRQVVEEHGERKFLQMIEDLADPSKITMTFETVIPGFISRSVAKLKAVPVLS